MSKPEILQRLKENLQTAILIELSTLPPYLCAYWSIHGTSVNAKHVKKFIHSVVQEEMLHMAMACNILNAIGGKPVLNDATMLAQFPCPLPGHSKTNNAFTVCLSKCCPDAMETFLKIEMPEEFFGHKEHDDGWCTIGEFYDEIEELIKSELLTDSDFSNGRQVGNKYNPAHGTLYEVHSREDALKALEEIIDQGEGHSGKMYDKDHQLTHYWKFQAIYDLMDNEIWDFEKEVYNMASDPDEIIFPDEAKKLNLQFNTAWSQMLNELHLAFNSETPALDKSIELMFLLKNPAISLMQIPLVGKTGNAGPTFRYLKAI
jgi:rubrerythrin